jgi:hypothetical protein
VKLDRDVVTELEAVLLAMDGGQDRIALAIGGP